MPHTPSFRKNFDAQALFGVDDFEALSDAERDELYLKHARGVVAAAQAAVNDAEAAAGRMQDKVGKAESAAAEAAAALKAAQADIGPAEKRLAAALADLDAIAPGTTVTPATATAQAENN